MELNELFGIIEKNLAKTNQELGFSFSEKTDNSLTFKSEKGIYRITYDNSTSTIAFETAYLDKGEDPEFYTISRSLFELDSASEKDSRSISNELSDEIERLFKVKKKVDLDKVKMPKAVSRGKAKSGLISYDTDSLANRFGALYPEFKDIIKLNIATYGEFLPEDFFINYGTPHCINIIKNGPESERKRLFKMLGDVFEDGTNEVQDIIAVTILGEMKNDPDMMAVADKYMTEYMSGPVHEVNKITCKSNSYTKKLENPPKYKPKKAKSFTAANALGQGR